MKPALIVLALCLAGCTTVDRNIVAVGLCERTPGCTVTKTPRDDGPPQVRAMEDRKPVSRTTEK